MWFIVVAATAIFLGYSYFVSIFNYWKDRGVPHPKVSKLFGNLSEALVLKKNIAQIYDEIYRKYSTLRYIGFYKIRQPGIIVKDPELIKEVLVKNFNSFHMNDIIVNEDIDPLIIRNPFFASGDKWKTLRNQLTPSFTSKRIKCMIPLMDEVAKRLVKHLQEVTATCIDAKELCAQYATDVVASCAFGLETNCFVNPDSEFRKVGKKIMSPSQSFLAALKSMVQFVIPSLAKLLKIQFIPDDCADYFRKIIVDTLQYRKTQKVVRNDFLDFMVELRAKLGEEAFSNEDITAHALSFLLDGFETSSIALSFALFEMANNPHLQEKLKNEINTVLDQHQNKLTYEAVQEMKYLDDFVCESLRMHPPGLFLSKVCTKAFSLPSPTGDGAEVTIEPGITVVVPVYSIHYDPKYYSNPETFDPDRFSEQNREKLGKFTYLPFGEGPRMCLGQKFAFAQIKVAIVNLVTNYEIQVNEKTIVPIQVDPTYFLLAAKGGIWLNFQKINQ